MVKFLTTALGGLTALAVAGLATPSGQAMLGSPQAPLAIPVSVISDPGAVGPMNVTVPAATPVSAMPGVARPIPIVSKRHVSAPMAQFARPVHRLTARRVYSVPTPTGLPIGGVGGIGSLMQLLPGMLQQTAPAPSLYSYGYAPAPAPQAAPAPQPIAAPGLNQSNQSDGLEHR
jgi:CRISPR-associated Cas5-like protein